MCSICRSQLTAGHATTCQICRKEVTSYIKIYYAGVPLPKAPPAPPPPLPGNIPALMNESHEEVRLRGSRVERLVAIEEHLGQDTASFSLDELLEIVGVTVPECLRQEYADGNLEKYGNGMLKEVASRLKKDSTLLHPDKLPLDDNSRDKFPR